MVEPPAPVVRDNRSSRGCLLAALVPLGVVVGVMLLYAAYAAFTGTAPDWTQTATTCVQPDSVTYADGTYEVTVEEPTVSLSLDDAAPYAVVGRAGSQGSYGVFVELSSSRYPEQTTCRWTSDRVEIVESGGIVHTVPAEVFMGGR